MKLKTALTALAALAILLVVAPPLPAAEPQTLHGEFVWERTDGNTSGALEAVFEATGEATWKVSFHFTFEDEKHLYVGTAEGSLTEGQLHGQVLTDGEEPKPFVFEGAFAEGVFKGTHASLRDGERRATGTMTLGRR